MWGSNKNSVGTDSVHVDTLPTFQIVQMNVTVLGDQVDYVVLITRLQIK